jgi:hypothetical protein
VTLREAWPGPAPANRGKPVHVVDWPAGRTDGHALCGRQVERVAVFALGWAQHVGVTRCRVCDQRTEERLSGGATVIPLPIGRR